MGKCNYRYSLSRHIVVPKIGKNEEVEFVNIKFIDDQKEESFYTCNLDAHVEGKCILHCDKEELSLDEKDLAGFNKAFTEILHVDRSEVYGIKFPNISMNYDDLMKINSPIKSTGIDWLQIKEMIFNECIFLESINISDIERVVFNSCNIKSTLTIGEGVYEIDIDSGSQIQELVLTQEEVLRDSSYSIRIDCSKIGNFIAKHLVYPYGKVEIRDSTISSIQMKHSCFNEGSWFVRNNIGKFKLEEVEYKKDSVFELSECNIKELSIKNLYLQPDAFHILNTKVSDCFVLFDSNFSNAVFQHVDLCSSNIEIEGCNFIGNNYTKFSNVNWGKFQLDKGKNNRDTLRQLKHINDIQGNYIQANKFYAFEMEKYGEEIKDSKNYLEKIVFTISKNLSNFSQDWLLPIFWFFLIGSMVVDIIILETPTAIVIFPGIIAFILSLKILLTLSIIRSGSLQYFKWIFLTLNIVSYQVFHYQKIIDLNKVIILLSPFNTKPDSTILVNIVFILFKLFTILVGYHLVTALRFHTRRK